MSPDLAEVGVVKIVLADLRLKGGLLEGLHFLNLLMALEVYEHCEETGGLEDYLGSDFWGTLYVPMKALGHYFIGKGRHKGYQVEQL